jgi:hypothetical protein
MGNNVSAGNIAIAVGDTYTVTADGLFFTEQVRVGDFLIAEVATAAGAGSALANWTVVQSNIDVATAAATSGAAVKVYQVMILQISQLIQLVGFNLQIKHLQHLLVMVQLLHIQLHTI